jgi:hypothetical protein
MTHLFGTKRLLVLLALLMALLPLLAQAKSPYYEQGNDLDLDAVASIFGDSKNLLEFEGRINDDRYNISNLDLDRDGYIDYLRVIESLYRDSHIIKIQAVLGYNTYRKVAEIEVYRDRYGDPMVTVIGARHIYGPGYIFDAYYAKTPRIFRSFWGKRHYRPYVSGYQWNRWPRWYKHRRPMSHRRYQQGVRRYIDKRHRYERVYAPEEHYNKSKRYRRDRAHTRPHKTYDHKGKSHKDHVHQKPKNYHPKPQHQPRPKPVHKPKPHTKPHAKPTPRPVPKTQPHGVQDRIRAAQQKTAREIAEKKKRREHEQEALR